MRLALVWLAHALMDDPLYAACRGLVHTTVEDDGFTTHSARPTPSAPERQRVMQNSGGQRLETKKSLGKRCNEAAEAAANTDGTRQKYWLVRFVEVETGINRKEKHRFEAAKKRVYRSWKLYTKTTKDKAAELKQLQESAGAQAKKGDRNRRRLVGGGRKPMAPALREGLFQWFVDSISNIKGRIPGFLILAQAAIIANDLADFYKEQVLLGLLEQGAVPQIPKLTKVWLSRWRLEYGITWRTVNLRFKCSWLVMKRRLSVARIT